MRSLRFRLTLWFSLAVTLTAGMAAGIGYFVVRKQVFDGIDFLLEAEVQEVVQRVGDQPEKLSDDGVVSALRGHTEIDAPIYYFQVHRDGPGVIFRSHNLGELFLPDLSDGGPLVRTVQLDDEMIRMREQFYGDLHVQVATSLEQVAALMERYRRVLILGIPLLFAGSIITGLFLSNIALVPVRAMQRSAQRISASNLSERLPVPHGRDEIAALARLLNELFNRLEAAFEQVKRFTADASHELKTPLSLIRLHAERIAQSPRLDDTDRTQVESQLEEITRLNTLVESLLFLARADAGSLPLNRRRHATAGFIRGFAEDAVTLAEDRGQHFSIVRNDDQTAVFDAVMLRQVLLNILSNALRFTPKGRSITIDSRHHGGAWTIEVIDEGPGVPDHEIENIFGRFVRGTGAETRSPGGSGLGLAIARSITEAHGGTITARRAPAGGLAVTVRLPVG